MKFIIALLFAVLLTSCASYEKTVAERDDSLNGFAKNGNYGGQYTHTVKYK